MGVYNRWGRRAEIPDARGIFVPAMRPPHHPSHPRFPHRHARSPRLKHCGGDVLSGRTHCHSGGNRSPESLSTVPARSGPRGGDGRTVGEGRKTPGAVIPCGRGIRKRSDYIPHRYGIQSLYYWAGPVATDGKRTWRRDWFCGGRAQSPLRATTRSPASLYWAGAGPPKAKTLDSGCCRSGSWGAAGDSNRHRRVGEFAILGVWIPASKRE